MKHLSFIILSLFSAIALFAVPAKRITKAITVDGKVVTVTFTGDENCHYWLAEDGRKFRHKDGGYTLLADGELGKVMAKPKRMAPAVKETLEALNNGFGQMRKAPAVQRRAQFSGTKKGLVILVNFADNDFTCCDDPKAEYTRVVSELNYKGSKNHGSVRDYFLEQSYGKFDFLLDVAGPYKLANPMVYYGGNDEDGNDKRPGKMVLEAVQQADADVDFTQYDWDGDGVVDQLFIVYAGYCEAQWGGDDTIWPHAWDLTSALGGGNSYRFDGMKISSYACGSELSGNSGNEMDGVGTFCHEFSHCFGLPDFYCTDYSHNSLTMGDWSVLDNGCYNGGGYTPCSYTAYERWACGWLEPTELTGPEFVKDFADINESGDAYVLYNEAYKDEFYIMQNIQKTGWNAKAPAKGMLVLHVDYSANEWYWNSPNNNASHLRMTPICADNKHNTSTLSGDTYPGSSKNTSLTDTSSPAAELFHANKDGRKYMGKPITKIAEAGGLISFTFDGGIKIAVPTGLKATLGKDGEIIASWTPVENAETYTIRYGVYEDDGVQETVLMDEDFAKCILPKDGSGDIGPLLDYYLNMQGCTGEKLYRGVSGLKMSSSQKDGELMTPLLSSPTNRIRVNIDTNKYGTDKASLTINIGPEGLVNPDAIIGPLPVGEPIEQYIDLKRSNFLFSLISTKRCYLKRLTITAVGVDPYKAPITLLGIKEQPYIIKPQQGAQRYWLQIQASALGMFSEWSDKIIVEERASDIDGITVLNNAQRSARPGIYNLKGQRVGAGYKGIVVKNGIKVLQ